MCLYNGIGVYVIFKNIWIYYFKFNGLSFNLLKFKLIYFEFLMSICIIWVINLVFFFILKFIKNVFLSIVSIVNKEYNDKWMVMYVSVKSYWCLWVYLDGGCIG